MLKNHVEVEAHDESGEQNQAEQGHLEEHGEDVEPLHLTQQVGARYEENFIRNIEQLGAKRQRKPRTRFDEECYVASDLTADINALTLKMPFLENIPVSGKKRQNQSMIPL